jgi:serine/threonine protein kinase
LRLTRDFRCHIRLEAGTGRALDAVHQAGLLHRDLKPANIALRDNGQPVLIDFGAVRVSSQGQTTMYTKVYTSGYAPIEQVDGLEQGPMSDLYGFGATFYRAIGGTLQPAQDRDRATRRGNSDPQKPAIELGAGRYPTAVLRALNEALRVEPAERPLSVRDMATFLLGAIGSTPTLRCWSQPQGEQPMKTTLAILLVAAGVTGHKSP